MSDTKSASYSDLTKALFGRREIRSYANDITRDNLIFELQKAMDVHNINRMEIEYLWNYYRGDQPILRRTKTVRPEICNKIVENRANEIVTFKVGYMCGGPIQYVGGNTSKTVAKDIMDLNRMMFSVSKENRDREIVEWQAICGTAYRMILPYSGYDEEMESPFELYTVDPRNCFVVYSCQLLKYPLMGVKYYTDDNAITHYSVYTRDKYFLVEGNSIVLEEEHQLGMVPIFEYPANNARLGAFEIVLPLLDALNNVESNRLDGMEQTVQAFIKFINCDITAEDFEKLRDLGAIKVKSTDNSVNTDVDVVKNELNQDQTQTMKDDIYNSILTICGMPNRNGGSSTSDTGSAVILRDGWTLAEARAKDSETIFKESEKNMLKLVLRICKELVGLQLKPSDIDLQFTRRNYENVQTKSQVLVSMLNNNKIHPLLAFQHCGMFVDPERAYSMSQKYYEQNTNTANNIEQVREDDKTQNMSEKTENANEVKED